MDNPSSPIDAWSNLPRVPRLAASLQLHMLPLPPQPATTMNRRIAISYAIPSAWALASLGGLPALAQTSTALPLSTAINRAGKMRAMSQRMSKAYVQATLNVLPERARDTMLATQTMVTQGLKELSAGAPPADVLPLLNTLSRQGEALFSLTAGTVRTEAVADVVRHADAMLEDAERVTRAYEKANTHPSARLVNTAGRQRMLCQRAARAYFMLANGKPQPEMRQQLDAARKGFAEGLDYLQASAVSTAHIRQELELAKGQWLFFESALKRPASTDTLQTIATTSERMYDAMDNLTGLYDAVVRDLFA